MVALVTISCAEKRPVAQEDIVPTPVYTYHTVQYRGETLGLIARWYTGDTANWKLIAQENEGLRPERIKLGDIIRIPDEIVVQREPMPSSFVVRSVPKTAPDTTTERKQEQQQALEAVDEVPVAEAEDTIESAEEELDELMLDVEAESEEASADAVEAMEEVEAEVEAEPTEPEQPEVDPEEAERERLLEELLGE